MSKVLLVAWREFRHTALTKAFIIGAVFTPALIAVVFLVMPKLLKTNIPPLKGTLAIVDPTGRWAPALEKELEPEQLRIHAMGIRESLERMSAGENLDLSALMVPVELEVKNFDPPADVSDLKDKVRRGEFVALGIVSAEALDPDVSETQNTLEFYVPTDAVPKHTELLQNVLAHAVVRARVENTGMDVNAARALVRRPEAFTRRLAPSGSEAKETTELRIFIPMGFMMLLWIATFTSGNYLLTTTIEEKSNKVMEVLLSAVSPFQLMGGKILGQAGVSFLMLAMYGGLGIAALVAFAVMDLVPPLHLLYLVLYFFMAFFMIASIMAGVGSAVSELREAQALITPAMLLLMIPLLLWFPIINDPNGVLATVTSFIPPLIPFVMILRVTAASDPVPFWQIIATLFAGYCWMFVMIWMCAKIFRVGVLMTGKPPTPLELLRWVRYR
jgi:ABC-2 type transport system permease protein